MKHTNGMLQSSSYVWWFLSCHLPWLSLYF